MVAGERKSAADAEVVFFFLGVEKEIVCLEEGFGGPAVVEEDVGGVCFFKNFGECLGVCLGVGSGGGVDEKGCLEPFAFSVLLGLFQDLEGLVLEFEELWVNGDVCGAL